MSDLTLEAPTAPWDHPYEGDPSFIDRCIHCGYVGSYAHTREFYVKYVWPAGQMNSDRGVGKRIRDLSVLSDFASCNGSVAMVSAPAPRSCRNSVKETQ